MAKLRYYLLLDKINIHAANAISSPLTYGFPSVTGFLGAVHALSRKIESAEPIYFNGVMVACHQCDVQVYRPHDFADYTFKLTRNPIGKDGQNRSIIEEGKVHTTVSLVVEVICDRNVLNDEQEQMKFEAQIKQKLLQQRVAGGSVQSIGLVRLYKVTDSINDIIARLLPAFVLVEAKQDLQAITQELQQTDSTATTFDALIETAKIHHCPQDDQNQWQAQSVKKQRGWLVPMHLGYQAISPVFSAGRVANLRDNHHESQFVECIYGLGKWVFPYRLHEHFRQAFWRYQAATKQSNGTELYKIYQEYND